MRRATGWLQKHRKTNAAEPQVQVFIQGLQIGILKEKDMQGIAPNTDIKVSDQLSKPRAPVHLCPMLWII